MISTLGPLGMTVPMWYCPVRPNDFSADDVWCVANRGHSLTSLADLTAAVTRAYSPQLAVCYHAWWVPRQGSTGVFPTNAWPTTQADMRVGNEPILTDRAASLNSNDPLKLGNGAAHAYNGKLKSSNLLFGDGHVEQHKAGQIQMRYYGNYYNFY
jgi:prepilin-type processing-associated H-X9-DG protein